jgi:hypothetical protein
MKLRIHPITLLCALAVLAPAIATASSLDVNADAAMGASSSSACGVPGAGCGLEVLVTSPATAAFVQSDHMLNGGGEDQVRISFYIDGGHPNPANPANLLSVGAPGHIRAVIVLQDFIPLGTKMVVFLRRNAAGTSWRLHVWTRDSISGNFVEAGAGFLVGGGAVTATRVDIEWDSTGGNGAGIVRSFRTLDSPGSPTVNIFPNRTNLNLAGQTLGILQAGDPGFGSAGSPSGSMYLDEFVISRL